MKFFKMTLLTIATATLLLQGCGSDDSDDSPSSETPTQPGFNRAIVGVWNSDNPEDNLTAVAFLDDGTYVVVQVDEDESETNPDNGMEWGKYKVDKTTGILTNSVLFDGNDSSGLSDKVTTYAEVVNDKLTLRIDENNNGAIDSNESFTFSRIKSEGLLGYWKNTTTDDSVLALIFTDEATNGEDDGSYVQIGVDSAPMMDNPLNGMEWGNYSVNPTTKALSTSQIYDDNSEAGLSDDIMRYVKVSGDTLTLEFDENGNGMIDSGESLNFQRQQQLTFKNIRVSRFIYWLILLFLG